ncbi:MAG: DUF1998 domain-containing protein [Acidobacteriota bacterium]
MRKRAIRRGQLIAPFGPGAMTVMRDGTSLIAAGLDHWYEPEVAGNGEYDPTEFWFGEWRLERELGVKYFGLPPDYRKRRLDMPSSAPNSELTIPFLRFPQWHVCPRCQRLERSPLVLRDFPRCPACSDRVDRGGRAPAMVQVRFIALCDQGHLQDFPWREWVHASIHPGCDRPMRLVAMGGASLAATRVECECGLKRNLEHITDADSPGGDKAPSSFLTRNLAQGTEYPCEGRFPWLGDEKGRGCVRPLRGALRGATNVYFSVVRSAVYLPRGGSDVPSELVELLENPPLSTLIGLLRTRDYPLEPAVLRGQQGQLLREFSDKEIRLALERVTTDSPVEDVERGNTDDAETAFRREEHAVLRTARSDEQLFTCPQDLSDYGGAITMSFARVTLIPKLRETRAFAGFSRVFAENDQSLDDRKAMLWRTIPATQWLPAYLVFGEGIYLELNEVILQRWEGRPEILERTDRLGDRFQLVLQRRRLGPRYLSPRLVLLHTLAHLLMNQLTFDCGYSTASLRERLYVSADRTAPMAGLLIYTAAGDAEGTMGGLVRMGKPGNLEPVIERALLNARWCSADPVCMELGELGGQGPDSCNLAACHNCALAPETSCEEFNRFLDRGLVVGTLERPTIGFFDSGGGAGNVAFDDRERL